MKRPSNFVLILILGALSTVTPFAVDLYLPAFAQVAKDLHTTVPRIALSLSSYFIGMSIGQLFYGPVLDRYGRKRPLYFGLSLFILASVGCLLSRSVEGLIAFRFLQALGGCSAGVASTAMVRDFFPAREGAKIFSLLMLILGVSPLLAPTIGGYLTVLFGWQSIFILLIALTLLILAATLFFLPEGHTPDPTVSFRPKAIFASFVKIFKNHQFFTYALAGAFSFSGLFSYLAASPTIFIDVFHLSPQAFGAVFAFLAAGLIGANQVNILLMRRFSSQQIFQGAVVSQSLVSLVFLIGTLQGGFGLEATIALLFLYLTIAGFTYPNAAALAMAPFDRNAGSASALLGFLQIGVGALTSGAVGLSPTGEIWPAIALMAAAAWLGALFLFIGKRRLKV